MENAKTLKKCYVKQDHIVSLRTVNVALFYIFIFNAVFIPNDNFNLKILSLGALLVLNVTNVFTPKSADERVAFVIGFLVTGFTIVKSFLLTTDLIGNVRIGYPGFILLLLPVIKRYKIDFYKAFMAVLKALALLTVVLACLDLLHIVDMYANPILNWYSESGNAMIGKGAHLPLYYMIFFKTSPLLFVCLVDAMKNKKIIWELIVIGALLLNGTRANLAMLFVTIVFYACFLQRDKYLRWIVILLAGVALMILLLDGRVFDFVIDIFQRKSSGDVTRAGHLKGIFEVWEANPLKFFVGSGYNSKFYSYGINDYTSNVELSYWNLLRQIGLFSFVAFMFAYLYPIVRLVKKKESYIYILAYVVYLAIAYTNPFLYSSTGVTMLLFMYYLIGKEFKKGKLTGERSL